MAYQPRQKIKTLDELAALREQWRSQGQRAVWTNGCFDILHAGHVTYLEKAAQLGDLLILGLNSDRSVRQNKGPTRPINNEIDRAQVIAALECIDYVAILDDATMVRPLDLLKPDIFAKGGDYNLETLDPGERQAVEAYGGEIILIPMVPGKSTTGTIERMKAGDA